MKKNTLIFVLFLLFSLSSCSSSTSQNQPPAESVSKESLKYDSNVRVFFSVDNGRSYTDGVRVLPVGQEIFMKVFIQVSYQHDKDVKIVKADIIIPNVDGIEAFYNTGQFLTPKKDLVNGILTYSPSIIAKKVPEEVILTFKFIPLKSGLQSLRIIFDENLVSSEDYFDTITFEDRK